MIFPWDNYFILCPGCLRVCAIDYFSKSLCCHLSPKEKPETIELLRIHRDIIWTIGYQAPRRTIGASRDIGPKSVHKYIRKTAKFTKIPSKKDKEV